MATLMDLTKQHFEGFEVLKYLGRVKNNSTWECLCSCGSTFVSNTGNIRSGHTTSCGCRKSQNISKKLTKHGYTIGGKNGGKKTEYAIWRAIKYRCLVPTSVNYAEYGGRGISICDRWKNSFENFLEDMGNRPSDDHSIDRINNNEGYHPENCRWATSKQQAYNRRTNVVLTIDGDSRLLSEWAKELQLNEETLKRLYFSKGLKSMVELKEAKIKRIRNKPKKRALRVKIGDLIFQDAESAAKHLDLHVSNICRWVKAGKAEYLPTIEFDHSTEITNELP